MHRNGSLFSLTGSCEPGKLPQLQDVLFSTFIEYFNNPPTERELRRAKNQLKSSIFMNLEQRSLLCEDIGRQVSELCFLTNLKVSIYGYRIPNDELCDRIDSITSEYMLSVMKEILSSTPTIVAVSDGRSLRKLPDHHVVSAALNQWLQTV